MRNIMIGGGCLVLFTALACVPMSESTSALHMPEGDVAAGRAAFVDLKCHGCHQVAGVALPASVADPIVPVTLGGVVVTERTDTMLIGAIVNPSHAISPGQAPDLLRVGTRSRMGDYTSVMTVRQLVDLVAFLRAQYKVSAPQPYV